MIIHLRATLPTLVTFVLVSILLGGIASAQQLSVVAFNRESAEPSAVALVSTPTPQVTEHRNFWDKHNCILFSAVAATSAADFALTRSNLQNGGTELNPMVRVFGKSTAGLAVNFAGQTAGVMGVSYLFHKTGHHKLERAISYVSIGSSATAVSFNLAHR